MSLRHPLVAFVVIALAVVALPTLAGEDPAPAGVVDRRAPNPPRGSVAPVQSRQRLRPAPRDPFSPPPALGGRLVSSSTAAASPRLSKDPLEGLEIRALIVLRGGRSGAIVSLGGRRWMIRKGDQLPLGGLAARVESITRDGLELQLVNPAGLPIGQRRRVRQ
ncbi:MAG: hypothetical protein JKY65_16340 [Planctomycetes bacterium]|nr:hypothetical protein [Planctomycetota bacterium]